MPFDQRRKAAIKGQTTIRRHDHTPGIIPAHKLQNLADICGRAFPGFLQIITSDYPMRQARRPAKIVEIKPTWPVWLRRVTLETGYTGR